MRFTNNLMSAAWWADWFGLLLGSAISAAAFVFFINPYNIIPGGVYGASIVLHNLFPSIQVGTFGYFLDVPLLLMSILLLGKGMGARTILAVLITPLFMNLMSLAAYPTPEALEALDPSQLLDGKLDMSQHLMLATLTGSTLTGIGCGIVLRCRATSGGTDIIAMLMQKFIHIPFSRAILMADGTVVIVGLAVVVLLHGEENTGSYLLPFYSLLAIYVNSRVLAHVISGSKDDKILYIISDESSKRLRSFILHDLDRSATVIPAKGLYSDQHKDMVMIVVHNKEVPSIKEHIREVDPSAFIIVTDAYDAFGEGWKELPYHGEINPE